jgi:hypothetical protein
MDQDVRGAVRHPGFGLRDVGLRVQGGDQGQAARAHPAFVGAGPRRPARTADYACLVRQGERQTGDYMLR